MFYRISYTLEDRAPRFPGNPENRVRPVLSIAEGHACNAAEVSLFTHNGTHVDLPNHYHAAGRQVADYDVCELIFRHPVLIRLEAGERQAITAASLEPFRSRLDEKDVLLLRTGFGSKRQTPAYLNNPHLTEDAARFLRSLPTLRAIGLDCLSITNPAMQALGDRVHRILLDEAPDGKPVVIIEDLDLRDADRVSHFRRVFVVPLFVEGVDGMPCTVFGEDGAIA